MERGDDWKGRVKGRGLGDFEKNKTCWVLYRESWGIGFLILFLLL